MKALILSAGLGTRLRPITNHIPKPLMPVGGLTLLDFHIQKLASHGIKEIIINTHHLHAKIKRHIDDYPLKDIKIHLLHEKNILGTGGAIKNAEYLLKDEPFLVVNSDVIYSFDLSRIINNHLSTGAIATMVIKNTSCEPLQRVLSQKGRVVSIGYPASKEKSKRYLFAGIHVVNPEILSLIPQKKFCCINSNIYKKLIKKKRISSFLVKGYWHDVGLPLSYFAVCRDFLKGKLPGIFYKRSKGILFKKNMLKRGIKTPVYLGENSRISSRAEIGPHVMIMPECHIGKGAVVKESVLLNGTKVKRKEIIKKQIRYKKHILNF